MDTASKIEAILFIQGSPVEKADLAKILSLSDEEVASGIELLKGKLAGHGLELVEKENSVMLGTHRELGNLIEKIRKVELEKTLTKAALETISIILYQNGATRAQVDYVRGVNSSFILRNLMMRGLVERDINPKDKRQYLYKPTFDLLSYLGVGKVEEIPNFEETHKILTSKIDDLEQYERENQENI